MNDRTLRLVVGVLAAVGAAVAAYLTYTRLTHTSIACTTGGCETVQSSRYAAVAGVPVPLLGPGAYLAVLASKPLACQPTAEPARGFASSLRRQRR